MTDLGLYAHSLQHCEMRENAIKLAILENIQPTHCSLAAFLRLAPIEFYTPEFSNEAWSWPAMDLEPIDPSRRTSGTLRIDDEYYKYRLFRGPAGYFLELDE